MDYEEMVANIKEAQFKAGCNAPIATTLEQVKAEALRLAVACEEDMGVFMRPNGFVGFRAIADPFWTVADVALICNCRADGEKRII